MYPTQGQPSYPYYPTMTYPPSHDLSATQTYGWSYGYPYAMQHQQYQQYGQQAQAAVAAAKTQTTTARTAASTRTSTPAPPPLTHTTSTTSTFSSYTPHHARESVAAAATGGSGTRGSRRQSNLRGIFSKELPKLMYGFGDDKQVSNDTVAVMEEMLIEYIVDVCQTALTPTRKTRLQIEDLRRGLSRPADAKKLARMEELLFMQEDIKRARKQFEENEMAPGGMDI